jgi:nitrogen fixation protein FixH
MCCCGVFIMPVEPNGPNGAAAARPAAHVRHAEFKGWHALALFVGFFAIIASVNATMMTLAIRTMPGLDARNGYDPSQRFNAEARIAAERVARGWSADAGVRLVGSEARLVVALRTPDGHAVGGARATVTLQHPSDRKRDQRVVLQGDGGGRYSGVLPGITPGAWDLVIEARPATGDDLAFASRQRINLKG